MNSDNEFYDEAATQSLEDERRRLEEEEARLEATEHRDMLLNLKAVLGTDAGKQFVKFLLKNFDVGELPQRGIEGIELHETIGFLRAGQSIFKIVSQANDVIAGQMLSSIEREKHEKLQRLSELTSRR